MSYSVTQISISSSTDFLSDIYNILNSYSGDLFDEIVLNQDIQGTTIVENNLIFKKDGIDMIKMDMMQTTVSSSNNKIYFSSKNTPTSVAVSSPWSTTNSGKAYIIQTPYCIAIHNSTLTSSCNTLIISKTQLNTLGIYFKSGISLAASYGFDNIVIDPVSSDQVYDNKSSVMTQMLPIIIITSSANEYLPNVYAILKTQGISNSFREVRFGIRNFITDGRIAYEI